MSITYGSVCSGIESASVAWEPLGMQPAWFSEIEPFPCAVLSHHWPEVRNLGDMLDIADLIDMGLVEAPDVLVGGTPCQAFSVAGKRDSLDDDRGQLTLEYINILDAIDDERKRTNREPAVCVWENVPGVLNTKDNAFGCFLAGLAGESEPLQPSGRKWSNAGYVLGPKRAIAWRVLDAQHFGVAQRRRRVFVVASARNGFDPAAVLFEPEGVRRDIAPNATEGESAGTVLAGMPSETGRQVGALDTECGLNKMTMQSLHSGHVVTDRDVVGTLTARGMNALGARDIEEYAVHGSADGRVRKLTPIECERLQGFPDGHTLIPYRNKPADQCPDGPRYKALGNSKAVPVVRWVGQRLLENL